MSSETNSSLKRNDSCETFVNEKNLTNEKTESNIKTNTVSSSSTKFKPTRHFLLCLIIHINYYDTELNLDYQIKKKECNDIDRINYLKNIIEQCPGLYRINDWNEASSNRDKIVNLFSLFSRKVNSKPTGNTAKYEAMKIAISDTCWEQMNEALEVAETIPNIGKTWLSPVLTILLKFPYYEASEPEIVMNHYKRMGWSWANDRVSITKHIKPLRRSILNNAIIPNSRKLHNFYWAMGYMTFPKTFPKKSYEEGWSLLKKDLTNDIFIDDKKWNSHLESFLKSYRDKVSIPGIGLRLF